jgi:intein/homing endonuclease
VKELTVHEEKNYAITRLLLVSVTGEGRDVRLSSRMLEATPNHPVMTSGGERKIGEVNVGDRLLCPESFMVWYKEESAGGVQRVYNIVTTGSNTFIVNDVMVLQKTGKFADAKTGVSH